MLIRVHLWLDLFRRPPDPSATFPHGELELNRLSRTTLDLLSCGLDHLVAQGIGLKSHSDPVRSGLDQGAELPASVRAWSFNPGDPCRHFPRTEVKQFTTTVGIGLPPQIDFRNSCAGLCVHDCDFDDASRAKGGHDWLGRRFGPNHEFTIGNEIRSPSGRQVPASDIFLSGALT